MPARSRLLRFVALLLTAGFVTWWLAALILRLTIRDRVPYLSVLFYSSPPVVLAASMLLFGGLCFWAGRRRTAGAALAIGLLCGGWWWNSSFFAHPPADRTDAVRVLFWNCQHGYGGWKAIAEEIRAVDASLVGLVEGGPDSETRREFWTWEFAGHDVALAGGGIVLLTRGRVLHVERIDLGRRSKCGLFEVRLDGRRLIVILVDITSQPFIPRGPAFRALAELIDAQGGQPVLVMGDFNTPTRSVFVDRLRQSCRNAFETTGHGNSATWPLPLPVLPLDQVWLNERLRAVNCRHLWTTSSDHRPVVTDVSIPPRVPNDGAAR